MRRASSLAARAGVALGLAVGLALAADPLVRADEPPAPAPPAATSSLDAAKALLDQGRVAQALEAYQRLADGPGGEAPEVQAGLGRARLAAGDAQGATVPLRAAAKTRGSAEDHLTLGQALVAAARARMESAPKVDLESADQLKEAEAEAGLAARDPALAGKAAHVVGMARVAVGDAEGAIRALSVPATEGHPPARHLLADVLYGRGDFLGAAAAYESAGVPRGVAAAYAAAKDARVVAAYLRLVAESPADASLYDDLVRAARYAGAIPALEQALATLPATEDRRVQALRFKARGIVAESQSKTADAVEFYGRVVALDPGDALAHVSVGRALYRSAPRDPATLDRIAEEFLAALAARSDDATVRSTLVWFAGEDVNAAHTEWPDRRRLDRGLRLCRALSDADPGDSTGLQNLGNALRLAGDPERAVATLERAMETNPYDATLPNDLGIAHLAGGNPAAALADFQRSIRLDPASTAPRQNAGRLAWRAGDDDAATAQYAAALRSARSVGGNATTFRFLLDRVWRSRTVPGAR